MPIVSTFFGIVIRMYYREHEPAHFHAEYQSVQAKFDFEGRLIVGRMRSRTAKRLIREWAKAHKEDLEKNWNSALTGQPLDRIEPLE